MDNDSERMPCDLVVHDGLIIPLSLLRNHDAYMNAKIVTETSEYYAAYAKCTVPFNTPFHNTAELDKKIIRQLEAANFAMAVVPNMQAKLWRLTYRIRNTWSLKYGLKVGDRVLLDGTAPPGLLQLAPRVLYQVQPNGLLRPVDTPWRAADNVAPRGIMHGAGGEAVNAFPAGIQHPNMVPGMPAQYVPPRSDLIFRAPRLAGPVNTGTPAPPAGGSIAPQPLFIHGFEYQVGYFEKTYTSLDKISTREKRNKTVQIQKDLPHESVARCMEALWRSDNDVDGAEAWLRKTHLIEIFDSGDEGQKQIEEAGRGRPKKKQKMDSGSQTGILKLSSKERERGIREMGTLQKPSDKAMSHLRTSPKHVSFAQDNNRSQLLLGPGSSLRSSTQSNAASDFIPLDVALVAPSSDYDHGAPKRTQHEVIDLTSDGDDSMDLDEPRRRRPNPAVVDAPAVTGSLNSSQVFFGAARTVTPDPALWDNIFQDRSAAGISLKKPMEVDEITAAITSYEQPQNLQNIATAAEYVQATTVGQTTTVEQSMDKQPTNGNGNDEVMDADSDLEEGEIREDEPTAAAPKHASTDAQVNSNNGEQFSAKAGNGALPGLASRNDSATGFLRSSSGTLSNNSSFETPSNSSLYGGVSTRPSFGTLSKPVFGSAWQPVPKDSA